MDATLVLRLVPAFVAAVLVASRVTGRRPLGETADEVLRVLMVGLVAGRLAWLVLGGPDVWRNVVTTAILVRAGVVTGVGVLVAGWWVGRRDDDDRTWRLAVAVPAGLAGLGAWQASCQVEGLCGGIPLSWGLSLPGRAVPTFPASYVEAAFAFGLAWLAWRAVRRGDVATAWWFGAAYAVARVLIGFGRPALVSHPTMDQWWFVAVAVAAGFVARRTARA